MRNCEQRRQNVGLASEHRLGSLHLPFLIKVRFHRPLMQSERSPGGIDDAQVGVHAQPQPFEHRRQMPGSIAAPSTLAWRRMASSRAR